ncbi:MAG TPA: rRNA maturation RNase YbeY [Gammaproteobacteria bacterium]|nr:rRNA maturation RNase YbeY [Gammaproteobacteria bacterium]
MTTEAIAATGGLQLEVQYACADTALPAEQDFARWVQAVPGIGGHAVELVVRVVDEAESRALNKRYRGKDRPTNVLSFPFEAPPGVDCNHLGDIVICAAVVKREARQQHKPEQDHWAHMVVHGVLHLQGYDHQDDVQAEAMETLEKQVLQGLGIGDPYQNERR